ncbi:helix-turn-helix domain-containing protein [Murimonas intestini]|uniref:helix-turn-helix domain-containing protein n=1 Tax=Murimonas intestini TaxID=1337051 RepID=UPI0011DCEBE5|nr:helix-turn-helix domain-containing protein [Murimonas intestini]
MRKKRLFGRMKKGMVEVKKVSDSKNTHSRLSLRLLFSYLIIMVAPAIAIVVIYFAARDALLDVQKEKAYRLLSEAVINFDRQLEEIMNVGLYTSQQAELTEFLKNDKPESRQEQFYELYLMARSYPNYGLMNQAVGDIYILIKGMDYVIELPSVIPNTELGMLTLESFNSKNYNELMETFCEKYEYGNYLNIPNGKENWDQSDIALVRSLPSAYDDVQEGAVVITLDEATIKRLMEHSMIDGSAMSFILDDENHIIRGIGAHGAVKPGAAGTTWDEYRTANNIDKNSITYSIRSTYNNWKFISVTPNEVLLGQIGSIKYLIVILCIAAIGIGLIICFTYWYRRKNTIKRYVIFNDELSNRDVQENGNFWRSLNGFLDRVENLQTTVTKQQMIVHQEILRKILYGSYDSKEELEAELGEEAQAFYRAKGYYVVLVEFEDPLRENLSVPKKEFQGVVEQHFAENLKHTHWVYSVSQLSYALIVAGEDNMDAARLKEEFEKLNFYFYKDMPVQIFTGISEPVDELMQLPSAFEEASGISEYARLFGIRVPLLKGDLPSNQENFIFSIDMEMQLEQAIRTGTPEELEGLLKEIKEYYLNRFQEFSMMRHVLEILRCTVIRSLEKSKKDEEARIILKRVQKAQRPDEIFEEIRNAKKYYQNSEKNVDDESLIEVKRQLSKRIEDNYGDAGFNLARLADDIGVGERRLYKDFKEYFGVTFSEYLEQLRIRNACACLKEGMAVKDVAVRVGYSSDYSFRRAFKRVTGLPPSDFQKLV